MEHKEILDEMNSDMLSSAVRTVCQIYDNMKRENLIKWIEENPDYWRDFCKLETGEITPEYAEKIMMSLVNSNIMELQVAWLFKCSDKLTIYGKADTEN